MAEIPERLMRNGRPEDPDFEQNERLFRRYKQEHLVGGQFSGMGLSLALPVSTNREKYSLPEDVLLSPVDAFVGWGVISFRVADIPAALPQDEATNTFHPNHSPLDDNYSHSEVFCISIQNPAGHIEPSKRIRKLFRTTLGQRVVRLIDATI